MTKRRVGLVGYGWVAGAHITALEMIDGVEVAAICTSRDLDAAMIERDHGHPIEIMHDLDTLLGRSDIDVIDICNRSDRHSAVAIAAAEAGKHLIIEKPIALRLEDLRALQAAVARAGVRTCVCFEVRFSPQFTATRSLLDGELIGPLHYGEVDYFHEIGPSLRQYEWNRLRDGGGSSLLTAGCHAVDGLLMFMDDEVTEVTSYATVSPHPIFARYEYPTSMVTIMRFRNGAIGKVASVIDSWQPYQLPVRLVGRDGTIQDGKFWSTRIAGLHPDRWTELGVKLESSADVVEHPYLPQFKAFFEALDADREMPLTSLAIAAKSFDVVFAADRSAALGRTVPMNELAP